jgi:ParB family chromosome partitioning protein
MTDTSSALIPLNKLTAWDGNVRKTAGTDTALAELAASISAHGLLQSLVVRRDNNAAYAVVAGGRRLAALQLLSEQGKIAEDKLIECNVIADDADATEISLVENAIREDMHPADEFDAFRALIDKGMAAADVAARFGVTETVVIKRMKLARVSPVILQLYRGDKITLECLMAFAVTDDHARQEKLWKTGPAWVKTSARGIRDHLTEHEIDAGDRRVKLVTLKAYEKAGGTIRRDLFAEGNDGIFIDNIQLLDQLVAAKLEKTADSLRKEGWKWIEVLLENGYDTRAKFRRVEINEGPLPEKLQAEHDKITAELKKLEAKKNPSEADEQRAEEIAERLYELDYDRPEIFKPEHVAIAGAFIEIEPDGKLDIMRGYVKPEDASAIKSASSDGKNASTKAKSPDKAGLSQSLLADLTAHRTAAIAALLADTPRVALAAIVHSIGSTYFYSSRSAGSLNFEIRRTNYPAGFVERCKPHGIAEIDKTRLNWKKTVPSKQGEFWQWCIDASDKTLLSLLAFFAALTCEHTDQLASSLDLDMTKWFKPTAGNFFGRIGKPDILKAIKEATGKGVAPATEKLKKSELAIFAERAIKDIAWLPKLLRSPSDKTTKKPLKKAA